MKLCTRLAENATEVEQRNSPAYLEEHEISFGFCIVSFIIKIAVHVPAFQREVVVKLPAHSGTDGNAEQVDLICRKLVGVSLVPENTGEKPDTQIVRRPMAQGESQRSSVGKAHRPAGRLDVMTHRETAEGSFPLIIQIYLTQPAKARLVFLNDSLLAGTGIGWNRHHFNRIKSRIRIADSKLNVQVQPLAEAVLSTQSANQAVYFVRVGIVMLIAKTTPADGRLKPGAKIMGQPHGRRVCLKVGHGLVIKFFVVEFV